MAHQSRYLLRALSITLTAAISLALVASNLLLAAPIVQAAPADIGGPLDQFFCNPGGNCADMPDNPPNPVWWECEYFQPGGASYNAYYQRCLHSKQVILPGGGSTKFTLWDMYIDMEPDRADGVFVDWWTPGSGGDTSTNGNQSTIQTKLWSTHRGCINGNCSDQVDMPFLETGFSCNPNGVHQTWSMNDTVTGDGGNVNVGWSWNEPAFYWCIGRPGVDKWSRYFDFTIEDSNQIGGAQTQAFDFANQQGFTYDNKTVGIAFYVQVSWWLVPPGPPLGNVCGGAYSCDWFENTGNWSDNYVYSS